MRAENELVKFLETLEWINRFFQEFSRPNVETTHSKMGKVRFFTKNNQSIRESASKSDKRDPIVCGGVNPPLPAIAMDNNPKNPKY